jgi:hypothetical protein
MTKLKLIPHQVILVDRIPNCNFCQMEDDEFVPGPYDFKTSMGPWANGCARHWRGYRQYTTLGVGKGQLWVTADQVTE